jgi:hypothetical protein
VAGYIHGLGGESGVTFAMSSGRSNLDTLTNAPAVPAGFEDSGLLLAVSSKDEAATAKAVVLVCRLFCVST